MNSDISRYLARPANVVNGTIPATASTIVASWAFTSANVLAQNHWADKLGEHLAFRSTVVCTLNISATPFHSGIMRLAWVPFGPAYIGGQSFRRTSRQELYTMPGININLSDLTQVVMKVPWINTIPYLEIGGETQAFNDITSPGTFFLINLTDVTPPAGTVAPTFNMFIHHEDVEVIGPNPVSWSNVQPQGMIEDLQASKAISVSLATGAKIAKFAAGLPLIPSGLDTVGWILQKASRAVSVFGFAKPLANERLMRVTPARGIYDSVATGCDPGASLGLLHDPGVPLLANAGTDVDEQSVAYIASVPGMISDFTVTTQGQGTLVWACAISPSSYYFQTGRTLLPFRERSSTFINPPFPAVAISPIMGLANLATYWNGSFDFEFFFSKTKFHAGRLAFVFVPGQFNSQYNVNFGPTGHKFPPYASTYSLDRTIVDLKQCSSYKHHVPYVHSHPMCPQQGITGYLCVYVVDPIRAPATVTSGIRAVVSVSSPDLQLTGFTGLSMAPTQNANNVFAQGALEDSGEQIMSLNQVAKRTCFRLRAATASPVQPFSQNLPIYTPNDTAPTACSMTPVDLVDYVRSAFAMERGGMILTEIPVSGRMRLQSTTFVGVPPNVTVDRLLFTGRDASYIQEDTPENVRVRAYVPRYSPYCGYKTDQGSITNQSYFAQEYGRIAPTAVFLNVDNAGAQQSYESGRCVADDHTFSFFIGWPLMVRGGNF